MENKTNVQATTAVSSPEVKQEVDSSLKAKLELNIINACKNLKGHTLLPLLIGRLGAGADLNKIHDARGDSLFAIACEARNIEVVKFLLSIEAIDLSDNDKQRFRNFTNSLQNDLNLLPLDPNAKTALKKNIKDTSTVFSRIEDKQKKRIEALKSAYENKNANIQDRFEKYLEYLLYRIKTGFATTKTFAGNANFDINQPIISSFVKESKIKKENKKSKDGSLETIAARAFYNFYIKKINDRANSIDDLNHILFEFSNVKKAYIHEPIRAIEKEFVQSHVAVINAFVDAIINARAANDVLEFSHYNLSHLTHIVIYNSVMIEDGRSDILLPTTLIEGVVNKFSEKSLHDDALNFCVRSFQLISKNNRSEAMENDNSLAKDETISEREKELIKARPNLGSYIIDLSITMAISHLDQVKSASQLDSELLDLLFYRVYEENQLEKVKTYLQKLLPAIINNQQKFDEASLIKIADRFYGILNRYNLNDEFAQEKHPQMKAMQEICEKYFISSCEKGIWVLPDRKFQDEKLLRLNAAPINIDAIKSALTSVCTPGNNSGDRNIVSKILENYGDQINAEEFDALIENCKNTKITELLDAKKKNQSRIGVMLNKMPEVKEKKSQEVSVSDEYVTNLAALYLSNREDRDAKLRDFFTQYYEKDKKPNGNRRNSSDLPGIEDLIRNSATSINNSSEPNIEVEDVVNALKIKASQAFYDLRNQEISKSNPSNLGGALKSFFAAEVEYNYVTNDSANRLQFYGSLLRDRIPLLLLGNQNCSADSELFLKILDPLLKGKENSDEAISFICDVIHRISSFENRIAISHSFISSLSPNQIKNHQTEINKIFDHNIASAFEFLLEYGFTQYHHNLFQDCNRYCPVIENPGDIADSVCRYLSEVQKLFLSSVDQKSTIDGLLLSAIATIIVNPERFGSSQESELFKSTKDAYDKYQVDESKRREAQRVASDVKKEEERELRATTHAIKREEEEARQENLAQARNNSSQDSDRSSDEGKKEEVRSKKLPALLSDNEYESNEKYQLCKKKFESSLLLYKECETLNTDHVKNIKNYSGIYELRIGGAQRILGHEEVVNGASTIVFDHFIADHSDTSRYSRDIDSYAKRVGSNNLRRSVSEESDGKGSDSSPENSGHDVERREARKKKEEGPNIDTNPKGGRQLGGQSQKSLDS